MERKGKGVKRYRRGDQVTVRSLEDILPMLDDSGAFERGPFLPEMAPYCRGEEAFNSAWASTARDVVQLVVGKPALRSRLAYAWSVPVRRSAVRAIAFVRSRVRGWRRNR
jgi:hypothetical protein